MDFLLRAHVLAVDVLLTSFKRRAHGIRYIHLAGFGQLDQHRQVRAIDDPPVGLLAGQQRQVGGLTAEQIGHDNHTGPLVDLIGRFANFFLFGIAVMIGVNGNGTHAVL